MANIKGGINMAQVAKILNYIVESTTDKINPYTVKSKYFSLKDCRWHTKTEIKYADLKSCLLYIADRLPEGV